MDILVGVNWIFLKDFLCYLQDVGVILSKIILVYCDINVPGFYSFCMHFILSLI